MDEEHIERFWAKVDKNGPVAREELGHCWIWTASKRNGYGAFGVHRHIKQAHRLAYELEYKDAPLLLRHRCDTPACVRPEHLEPGTKKDNTRDMLERNPNTCALDPQIVTKARQMAAAGQSFDSIKKQLQIQNHGVLMNAVTGRTFKHISQPPVPIEDIYRPKFIKLSEQDYTEIMIALKKPYRGQGRALALRYGVHPTMITAIKKGRVKGVSYV